MRVLSVLCLLLVAASAPGASAQTLVARDIGAALAPDGSAARAVALDLDALDAAAEARAPIALDVLGERLVATPDRLQRRGPGRYTVSAAIAGGGRLFLTVERGTVVGRVVTPRGEAVIAPAGGGHVAYRPAEGPETDDAIRPPAGLPGAPERGAADLLFPDELHIALFYTDPVATILGDGLHAYLQGTVDALRDILANSAVPLGVRVVHQGPVDYAESGLMATDLYAFRDSEDGLMEEVFAIREQTSADFMALITDAGTDACGIAFLANPADPSFEDYAFSVTRQSCQFGYVFSHEVGHNIGLTHDRFVVPNPIQTPYAYGFVNLDSVGVGRPAFRTTLSYTNACTARSVPCPRIPYYSNPEFLWNGQRMGDAAESDNARATRENTPIFSAYRAPVLVASVAGTTAGRAARPHPVCPDPSDLSACTLSAEPVPFTTATVTPGADGLFYIRTATGAEGVLLLYDGTYDPALPLSGLVGYAEPDAAAPASRRLLLAARLDGGEAYTLVTTGRAPADAGPYTTDVFGPGSSQIVVGTEDAAPAAEAIGIVLGAPAPNPSRGAIAVPLSVARTQAVEVALFDVLGRRVAVLSDGVLAAGAVHTVRIDGVPAGVYVIRARGADGTATQRVTRM